MPKHSSITYVLVSSNHYHLINWTHVHQDPGTCTQLKDGRYIVSYIGEQPRCIFCMTKDGIGSKEYTNKEIIDIIKNGQAKNS